MKFVMEMYEDDFYIDICYECTGYGDNYFINDDGELELFCPYCQFDDIDVIDNV